MPRISPLRIAIDKARAAYEKDPTLHSAWREWARYVNILEYGFDHDRLTRDAYITFSRTLWGFSSIPEEVRRKIRARSTAIFAEQVIQLLRITKPVSHESYNEWHRETIGRIQSTWENYFHLHYGQAQKWINILIKYYTALGDEGRYSQIQQYYQGVLHAPIDRIVYDLLRTANDVHYESGTMSGWFLGQRFPAWSRIADTQCYKRLQKAFRDLGDSNGIPPCSIELFGWMMNR
jgi:hypothetical protein